MKVTPVPDRLLVRPLDYADSREGEVVVADARPSPRGWDALNRAVGEITGESEARYRGLLEAAPDAMVVVNQDGEIVLLNVQAEKQFGYHRDVLVGQKVTNIIPEGFAERLIADDLRSAEDALAQQIGTGIELSGRRKDGSEFPIEIMLSPLDSAEGVLVTAAIRDISVRRKAEADLLQKVDELHRSNEDVSAGHATQRHLRAVGEELTRSNHELQDFASAASHDLQEPLRKIQAFGDRLVERSSGSLDDEAQDYVRRMQNAASRMQSLIDDLFEYSRVSTQPEPPRRVDLAQVVSEVLSDLEERIHTSNGHVGVGALPVILASPLQMRQLFQNLIANALKFHPAGIAPEVHVEGKDHDGAWEIRVRDNGIGFEERHAEKIFAPFQRLNGRQAYEGTGMGLAICRRIAALHGGTITATSQPGAGATFLISLPRTAVLDSVEPVA
jgi:PAS domain S-box-containing protein